MSPRDTQSYAWPRNDTINVFIQPLNGGLILSLNLHRPKVHSYTVYDETGWYAHLF